MYLKLKKARFHDTVIILLKKKKVITLDVNNIERIKYAKPSILNYISAMPCFGGVFPGRLEVYLKKKVNKTKLYLINIKYKDVLKLPDVYKNLIK